MQQFLDSIRAALAAETGLDADELIIESPRNPEHGDFAFPCFVLAKERKMAPPKIAAELCDAVNARLEGITGAAMGPYLNFTVERTLLAETIVSRVNAEGDAYGSSDEGAGKTIVIDLSSPNIAKPMSVGHLRSTVIGAALQRMFDALGYETVGINHIGDWGSQFGKLVAAVKRWGAEVDLDQNPIEGLLKLYVRFHDEVDDDPTLDEEARAAFRELESGEEGDVRETWRRLTKLSLAEFDRTYARLGVSFDAVRGESFYEPYLDQTVDRIVESGVTEESDGALIVDLTSFDENLAPCLLRKTDGTTLYATRDFAAVFHRWETYHFQRCLYVVGADQRLHFKQIKLVLERMGLEWEPSVEHIDFGMMRLPDGKMQTRKGRVVFLEDVLDRAVEEAARIMAEKNPEKGEDAETAEAVGVGAVIFNDFRRERVRDVEFRWEEALTFEGDTGPYLQYTHARLCSIERKAAAAGEGADTPDWAALAGAAPLLLAMGRYGDVLRSATREAEPSLVAAYLLSLGREVNTWYGANRVLGEEAGVTAARLALVSSAKIVLANGLRMLGLHAPQEM